MRFFAVALSLIGAASYAQTPEVPHKMNFAGMTLTIRDDARREIQSDVDALTRYARYYVMKVERARTYFPIIEKVFAEEGVPDDFKYLVLQESALVADAVSVSDAVGFWQFKDFTAREMGMRVDKDIDERMNLISASHGAAKYLKQNNYRFNNWLLALQSYQMGAGGVIRSMGDSQNGAKHMEITSDTYWYVKKFIAHKVTFENALAGEAQLKVITYQAEKGKTLREIAGEVSTEEDVLREYNKWLKASAIPEDRLYTLLIPVGNRDADFTKLILSSSKGSSLAASKAPVVTPSAPSTVNAIPVIVARSGETLTTLAQRGGIHVSALLRYNDVASDHAVHAGDVFFLSRKKSKGQQEYYKSKAGDDVRSISQQFGVKIRNLKKYNGIDEDKLPLGTLVWLQSGKPRSASPLPDAENVATLDDESFDWYTKSPKESGVPIVKEDVVAPRVIDTPVEVTVELIKSEIRTKHTAHEVKPGDTYYSVARQYGIEVTDLLAWNSLTIQDALKPAQILKVVENEAINDEGDKTGISTPEKMVHEVKSSDTLYSIARQYGVTIKDIMDWNHKKDFSLSRGEKLEIRRR